MRCLNEKIPVVGGDFLYHQVYFISLMLEASSFPKSVRFKVGNITVPHPDKEVSMDM